MKEIVLLSLVLSTFLTAAEYGFRDYMTDYFKKNSSSVDFTALDERTTVFKHLGVIDGTMDKYCILQGGTLYGEMKHDLGVERLPAHGADLVASYAALSKEDRLQKLFSDSRVGKLFLSSEEKAFNTNFKNFHSFECKLPGGEVLMSASIKGNVLVAEHKSESMKDFVWNNGRTGGIFTSSNETSEEYKKRMVSDFPTYESYFNTFKFTHSFNGEYRINDKISQKKNLSGFSSMGDIGEMSLYCEAHGGRFKKDGIPFREYLKGVFNKGGWSVFENDQGAVVSPFSGGYVCDGGNVEFSVVLEEPYVWRDGETVVFGYAKVSKDKRGAEPHKGVRSTAPKTSQSPSVSPEEMIVRQVAASKVPFGKQVGANVLSGFYNGTDAQGCDLVSLQKTVANIPVNKGRKDTFNYKVCNNQVIALGETGLPGVPRAKELDPIIAQVKTQCKAYGAYGSEYQGTIVSCRTLDVNHCNLEINIMQNGKLIDKRVHNTCK